jgi:hypothetical protein
MTVPEAVTRRYALIRVTKGDDLLPANDRRTLWRLCTYEDGPSHGLTEMARDVTYWGVWKYDHGFPTEADLLTDVDLTEWDYWQMVSSNLPTRRDAIAEVMRLSEAKR